MEPLVLSEASALISDFVHATHIEAKTRIKKEIFVAGRLIELILNWGIYLFCSAPVDAYLVVFLDLRLVV